MSPEPTTIARAARVVGFALLIPAGLLYAASGLVVPMPWLVGLWLAFVALAVYAVRHRTEPWRVLTVPVGAVVLWFVVVSAGGALLDWTA
ncbi:MAG: hypothetical protein ACRD2W_24705 [Acidimicrobiales bacterium]